MAWDTRAFKPNYQKADAASALAGKFYDSLTIACSTSSALSAAFGPRNESVEICNTTNSWAFLQFGIFGSVPAATAATGYPIAPNSDKIITIDPEVTGASVILAVGTGNVILTLGQGV